MTYKITPLAVAPLAAFLALAACGDKEPEIVGGMADPNADQIGELDPSMLPASERETRSYRCGDNSLVYVTYFTGDMKVAVRAERNGPQTFLTNEANAAPAEANTAAPDSEAPDSEAANEDAAPAADGPIRFSGEGYTLVGTGSTIQFARPGGSLQTCNS